MSGKNEEKEKKDDDRWVKAFERKLEEDPDGGRPAAQAFADKFVREANKRDEAAANESATETEEEKKKEAPDGE